MESDNASVISNIQKGSFGLSPLFLLYEDVLHVVSSFVCISFSFVKRSGNSIAHHLAKWGSLLVDEQVLLENYPSVISSFVSADIEALV